MSRPAAPRERPFARLRQALGLPLHRAAARLDISPRYLRALELGRVPLTIPMAQRMARAYNASVSQLTRAGGAGGTGRAGRGVETPAGPAAGSGSP